MNKSNPAMTKHLIAAMSEHATETKAKELQQLLLHFLQVLDSVDRLVNAATSSETGTERAGTSWLDHMQGLRQQILDGFTQAKVTFIDSVGQTFDPVWHEAVKIETRHDVTDYTILVELSRGCEWRGQVLRPAQVVVARQPQD